MKRALFLALVHCVIPSCWAQSTKAAARLEAEYYVAAYAQHYHVPVTLIIELESNWQPCTVSPKGAVGLMQLMPSTAQRLGVKDRCNIDQNVSGGVRYLAWLMQQFHNDLRLVTAAYYAGEGRIDRRALAYRNADVVAYVGKIRTSYLREAGVDPTIASTILRREVR